MGPALLIIALTVLVVAGAAFVTTRTRRRRALDLEPPEDRVTGDASTVLVAPEEEQDTATGTLVEPVEVEPVEVEPVEVSRSRSNRRSSLDRRSGSG